HGEVAIGLKIPAVKFRAELDAFDISLRVIKSAEHQRLTEISVVDQVGRDLVVSVASEIEIGAVLGRRLAAPEWNILNDPGVEIMRALRQHRAGAAADRRAG